MEVRILATAHKPLLWVLDMRQQTLATMVSAEVGKADGAHAFSPGASDAVWAQLTPKCKTVLHVRTLGEAKPVWLVVLAQTGHSVSRRTGDIRDIKVVVAGPISGPRTDQVSRSQTGRRDRPLSVTRTARFASLQLFPSWGLRRPDRASSDRSASRRPWAVGGHLAGRRLRAWPYGCGLSR